MSKVRDIMHIRVPRAQPETTLAELIQLFMRESVSAVPIVEPSGKLVGVASMRDAIAAVAELLQSNPGDTLATALESRTASAIMTPAAFVVGPDMPVAEVARQLHETGIRTAFVVDRGRLSGVVSAFDILRAVAQPT